MATTTIGGTTVPNPYVEAGVAVKGQDAGRQFAMANGSLRTHYVGTRRQFPLRWRGVTASERDTLWSKYRTRTVQVLKLPDSATTYDVVVVAASWEERLVTIGGGAWRYDVAFTLEEQQVS